MSFCSGGPLVCVTRAPPYGLLWVGITRSGINAWPGLELETYWL
jgi:hypothetical protein